MYIVYGDAPNLDKWTVKSIGGRGGLGQDGGNGKDGRPGKDARQKLSEAEFKEKFPSMCHAVANYKDALQKVMQTWDEMKIGSGSGYITKRNDGVIRFAKSDTKDFGKLTISSKFR